MVEGLHCFSKESVWFVLIHSEISIQIIYLHEALIEMFHGFIKENGQIVFFVNNSQKNGG